MEISEKLIEFAKNHAYPTADVKDVNMVTYLMDPDLGAPVDLKGNPLYGEDVLEAAIAKRLCMLASDDNYISGIYPIAFGIDENGVHAMFVTQNEDGEPSLETITFPYRPTEPEPEDGD